MKAIHFLSKMALFSSLVVGVGCAQKKNPIYKDGNPLSSSNAIIRAALMNGSELSDTINSKTKKLENQKNNLPQDHEGYALRLDNGAFNDNFIMTMAEIQGIPTPNGEFAGAKIVYFEKKGNKVYLFEQPTFKVNTESNSTKILLAEFNILSQDDNGVVIDFNEGTKRLMSASSYTSDDPTDTTAPQDKVSIDQSFIDKIQFVQDKYIQINQYVNLSYKDKVIPYEVKYTFSSFRQNPNFKAKESSYLNKVGFFETNPLTFPGTGEQVTLIQQYDISKPITYYISTDVPENFRQAVRDGILYWNKAYGKEILKVEDLPAGIEVHDAGYNILKWIEWDTAGFAYATMLHDPYTGEIMQTNVYMTSVFSTDAMQTAMKLMLRDMSGLRVKSPNDIASEIGNIKKSVEAKISKKLKLKIKGFDQSVLCQKDMGNELVVKTEIAQAFKLAQQAAEEGQDPSAIFLRYAQDTVRETVAHEIGHTLGLRHNFASSTTNNIPADLYKQAFQYYFYQGELAPGVVPASSVMDYSVVREATQIGAWIRTKDTALSYDTAAIGWGYSDKTVNDFNFGPFCTDGMADNVVFDCKRFDKLQDSFIETKYDLDNASDSMASTLVSKFYFLLSPELKDPAKRMNYIRSIPLSPAELVNRLGETMVNTSLNASKRTYYLKQLDNYGSITDEILDEVFAETYSYKQAEFDKLGGLSSLLTKPFIPVASVTKEGQTVYRLPITVGMIDGVDRALTSMMINFATEDEIAAIKMRTEKFIGVFDQELLATQLEILAQSQFVVKDANLEADLANLLMTVIFAESDAVVAKVGKAVIKAPYFNGNATTGNLRDLALKVLVKRDFYADAPLFGMETMKKAYDLEMKKLAVLNSALKAKYTSSLANYIVLEKRRFAPLAKVIAENFKQNAAK